MVGEDSVYLFCSHGNSHPPANISWLKSSQLDSSLTFTTTTVIVGGVSVSSRYATLLHIQCMSVVISIASCNDNLAILPLCILHMNDDGTV